MVFGSAQSSSEEVRVVAYQCLCEIAALYYQYIGQFMADVSAVMYCYFSTDDLYLLAVW